MSPNDACEKFNARYPVGTRVILRKDGGYLVDTKTRTTAGVVHGRDAVIFLEGINGYYLLDRVTPFEEIVRVAHGAPAADPLSNALQMTGCENEEDLIDMANVGWSLMDKIDHYTKAPSLIENWSPADDPAEIVGDLYNRLEEANACHTQAIEEIKSLQAALVEIRDAHPSGTSWSLMNDGTWREACRDLQRIARNRLADIGRRGGAALMTVEAPQVGSTYFDAERQPWRVVAFWKHPDHRSYHVGWTGEYVIVQEAGNYKNPLAFVLLADWTAKFTLAWEPLKVCRFCGFARMAPCTKRQTCPNLTDYRIDDDTAVDPEE